jgi:ribosomal protein S18 acetylase RimI-like enzyme
MISKATLNDAAVLVQLVNSAYRGEKSKQGWTTEADLLDGQRTDEAAIIDQLKKPGAVLLKYEAPGGALQACVYLEKQRDNLYLGMLTVAPHLQNSGLGKQLLQAAEAYGREQHCSTIVMTVISERHELIRWYERQGYHLTGESKPFPHGDPRFGIPKQSLMFVVLQKNLYDL